MTDTKQVRSLLDIACDIRGDWKKINFAAEPYLQAMEGMDTVDENYGADDGRSIVRYFLCNATTWRGEVARKIKAELKAMCGD